MYQRRIEALIKFGMGTRAGRVELEEGEIKDVRFESPLEFKNFKQTGFFIEADGKLVGTKNARMPITPPPVLPIPPVAPVKPAEPIAAVQPDPITPTPPAAATPVIGKRPQTETKLPVTPPVDDKSAAADTIKESAPVKLAISSDTPDENKKAQQVCPLCGKQKAKADTICKRCAKKGKPTTRA